MLAMVVAVPVGVMLVGAAWSALFGSLSSTARADEHEDGAATDA